MKAAPREDMEDLGSRWMAAMRAGDLAAAWDVSDLVLATPIEATEHQKPRHLQRIWDGSGFDGQRVFVRCYHGLGDTIQFARFLPALRRRARSIVTWMQPSLIPLMSQIESFGALLPLHDGVPDVEYDVDLEIMELAHALRVREQDLPLSVPYLSAPDGAASKPGRGTRLRVGLVWHIGSTWDVHRSIPDAELSVLADVPGVEWHVLQLGVGADRYDARLGPPPTTADIIETARRMKQLDLVLSIDSMPVHLAGALGVPVWTLLPHDADWRWGAGREFTPWYPTMRLFRQARETDWRSLLEDVADALRLAVRSPDRALHI